MRWTQLLLIVLLSAVWSSCSSTRWVNPDKRGEQQYTYDYNACEREIMNRQMTNAGVSSMYSNVNIDTERVENCLMKKGWRKIEDE